ncbi:MAG: 50S ribosomal protein L10 [Cryomorphaceae bacterium BACL7 MAG-120910-bin2]|jgi:large subunit ribosomal protein L10|nr:MAG: 50S ribosomal protein L10 [Cryomorphaceae bacterium BACL7 MAG-120910-bin2]KRO69700.1 MAG: 50S ribosomal protein L10 [Cryomorphaceae bacterium BACL7 MAG-120322-bin74]KRO83822.1 MAG: 50S ribosomal protein L10 [Cryomorphaceae bacterium BACL7 MAG-121220-bin83]
MTREEKNQLIEDLTATLESTATVYITDIAGLDAENTSNLRRACYKADIKMTVVKNALLLKAMERSTKDFGELTAVLKGNSSIMIAEAGNAPAKLIKEFRKKSKKPVLKGAYVEESIYIGDDLLDTLTNLKSKNELIGDVILLLQSPMKNVISGLQAGGGQTIAGLIKALEERNS